MIPTYPKSERARREALEPTPPPPASPKIIPQSRNQLQASPGNAAFAAAAARGSLASTSGFLPLQSTYGNAAASRSLQPKRTNDSKTAPPAFDTRPSVQRLPVTRGSPLQPKLTVGAAHDPYEQEADRVAQQVMRMPTLPTAATGQASVQQQTLEGNEVRRPNPWRLPSRRSPSAHPPTRREVLIPGLISSHVGRQRWRQPFTRQHARFHGAALWGRLQ